MISGLLCFATETHRKDILFSVPPWQIFLFAGYQRGAQPD